jgi:hypothetical protein
MQKLRNEQTLQLYFAQNALNVVKRKYEQRTVWESIYNEYMIHLENSKVFSLNRVENLHI